jgi:uncharacterized protein (DUF1697 family)
VPTHIGFLRAVNIGKRQYRTADLRAALIEAGYSDVETHIQTGNIKITCPVRSPARMERDLEALFLEDRGFEVVTVVVRPEELTEIVAHADELAASRPPTYGQYVTFLKREPSDDIVAAIEDLTSDGERFVVRGRVVHLLYDVPYGTSSSAALIERSAGPATNRNLTVVRTLADKWGS